jgi:hypothetical protein
MKKKQTPPSSDALPDIIPAPGRLAATRPPRRPTEHNYLLASVTVCGLNDWREIVSKAVEDAKAGDAQARAFLYRLLFDAARPSLMEVQANEIAFFDPLKDQVESIRMFKQHDGRELAPDIYEASQRVADAYNPFMERIDEPQSEPEVTGKSA